MNHAKKLMSLAKTGFNVFYVIAGITKFAPVYLCHSYPKCRNFKTKYFLFRWKRWLEEFHFAETHLENVQDTIEEILPCDVKTALDELNLGDLSKALSELEGEVKLLNRNQDHPQTWSINERRYSFSK